MKTSSKTSFLASTCEFSGVHFLFQPDIVGRSGEQISAKNRRNIHDTTGAAVSCFMLVRFLGSSNSKHVKHKKLPNPCQSLNLFVFFGRELELTQVKTTKILAKIQP